jgi:hypothetical protein
MAAKLGSTDVSFRLGAGEVAAVYLGSQEVWSAVPAAATLYFDGAVDTDWAEIGNWWLDAGSTQSAGRLPASADSVVASMSIQLNSTSAPTSIVDFTLGGGLVVLAIAITVSGVATFNEQAGNNATITGNAVFNDISANNGTVDGDATFNDSSVNDGTVTGTITDNR